MLMKLVAAVTTTEKWFWSVVGAIVYLEVCVWACLCIHFPPIPDPVFKKVDPFEYHWVKGSYDDDWDGCDPDLHYCYEKII